MSRKAESEDSGKIAACGDSICKCDIVAIIRAPLEQYPPSLNQVAILAEAGFRVAVVDTSSPAFPLYKFDSRAATNIERIHATTHAAQFDHKSATLIQRLRNAIAFRKCANLTISKLRPSVVIAYDPNAMVALGKIWRKHGSPRVVWQYHELSLPELANGGFLSRRAVQFAAANCSNADLVIFPDSNRARVYSEETKQRLEAAIVLNCPRRVTKLPENKLQFRLKPHGISEDAKLVYFQGWIGPSRCLEPVIESMAHWPQNSELVLVGPAPDHYRQSLEQLARNTGVSHRVHFLGMVPYQELMSLTVGATIGLSLVSDEVEKDLSWRYSAGAVNKRFEYMAAGVPQVANFGAGMQELIADNEVGVLVNAESPASIGSGIAALLADDVKRRRMAARARSLHLELYCYEQQIAGLVSKLKTWCGR